MNRNCSLARVIRSKNRQSIAGPSLGSSAFRARWLRLGPASERIINNNQARRCDGTFDPRSRSTLQRIMNGAPLRGKQEWLHFMGGAEPKDGLTLLLLPPSCSASRMLHCWNVRAASKGDGAKALCGSFPASLWVCFLQRQPGLPC